MNHGSPHSQNNAVYISSGLEETWSSDLFTDLGQFHSNLLVKSRRLKTSQAQLMQEQVKDFPNMTMQALQRYRNARLIFHANESEAEFRSTLTSIQQESFDADESLNSQLMHLQSEVRGLRHKMRKIQNEQNMAKNQNKLIKLELIHCIEEKVALDMEENSSQCECTLL